MKKKRTDLYVYNYERFDYTIAERTIEFIEAVCIIPEGRFVGKPMVLEEFQRKFIRDVFKVDKATGKRPVRQAILTMSRKNGKTGLIAALVIAALSGPLAVANAELSSIALTRDQAGMIYRYASGFIKMNHRLHDRIKMVDSRKHLEDKIIGSSFTSLSADHRSQLGRSPMICFWDEAGSFRQDSELFSTMETGQGAHENPLMVIISTEAPSDQDFFASLVDFCKNNPESESDYMMRFTTPTTDDPWDEKNWYKSNPALGKFLNLDDLRQAAKKAEAMPGRRANFFNLRLNQRVDADVSFLSRNVWHDDAHPDVLPTFEDLRDKEVSLGIDLSKRRDLTCVSWNGYDAENDLYITVPSFFLPKNAIPELQDRDKVDYRKWVESELLIACPGESMDYEFVGEYMISMVEKYNMLVSTGGFDPWRRDEFNQALNRIGAGDRFSTIKDVRQGFLSMSPIVDTFEQLAYEKKIWHGNHPILMWNVANCVVVRDGTSNRKLDKQRSYGKIDGAVATAMGLHALITAENDQDVSWWV